MSPNRAIIMVQMYCCIFVSIDFSMCQASRGTPHRCRPESCLTKVAVGNDENDNRFNCFLKEVNHAGR